MIYAIFESATGFILAFVSGAMIVAGEWHTTVSPECSSLGFYIVSLSMAVAYVGVQFL